MRYRDLLIEARDLLSRRGETWWSEKLDALAKELDGFDTPHASHAERTLGLFGGMGSLNDLVPSDPGDAKRLQALLEELHEQAVKWSRKS